MFCGERGGTQWQALVYIIKGELRLIRDGGVSTGGTGAVVAFGTGARHVIGVNPEFPPELFVMSYSGSEALALTRSHLGHTCGVMNPDNPHDIESLFRRIYEHAWDYAPERPGE